MTIKEYISNVLTKFNVTDVEVDIILLDNDLDGAVDIVDLTIAKTAIHKNLSTWMPVMKSVTEGGVNETWNSEAIKLYYSMLCKELGLDNVIADDNSIRDKSNIW